MTKELNEKTKKNAMNSSMIKWIYVFIVYLRDNPIKQTRKVKYETIDNLTTLLSCFSSVSVAML